MKILVTAKSKTSTKSLQESFTYDKVGNRLTKITNGGIEKYKYNIKNQLVELNKNHQVTKFNYDKQGNLIEEQRPEGIDYYNYNRFNQTIKAITKEGNTLVNRYDAEGLRFEIEENERLTKFIFYKDNIIAELDEKDNVISRFSRGYEVVSAEIGNNRYYYHQDEQGSTLNITNEAGDIENSYFYDAFGVMLESTEKIHNRITYTGQQFDGITQQYYLRARFYNPVIGRFTQEDVYRGDGLNLYGYCKANPVVYYDPSGYNTKRVCPESKTQAMDDTKGRVNTGNPVHQVSKSQYPNHTKMIENSETKGNSLKNLTRGEGTKAAEKNRYNSQKQIRKQQGGPPKGYDYDEFPYASTVEGGEGAHVEIVLSAENQAAGRDLGKFYRENGIKSGDKFDVELID